jgi:hypothetical protein
VVVSIIIIHRVLVKKQKNIHEQLVTSYDTIRYQIAKAQYENQSIQDKKGIHIIMEADRKNYPANALAIKKEILSIEQKLGKQIISTNERVIIQSQRNKKRIFTICVQIIGSIITILTIGMYKLFW